MRYAYLKNNNNKDQKRTKVLNLKFYLPFHLQQPDIRDKKVNVERHWMIVYKIQKVFSHKYVCGSVIALVRSKRK